MKNYIAIYSILIGLAVIGMWAVILTGQKLPEGNLELAFHLYAEFAMAVICLVSGVMMLRNKKFS
jgi:heme A synthase